MVGAILFLENLPGPAGTILRRAQEHTKEVRKVTELQEAAPELAWEARARYLQWERMEYEERPLPSGQRCWRWHGRHSHFWVRGRSTFSWRKVAGAGKKAEGCPALHHWHRNFILNGGPEDTGLREEAAADNVGGRDMEHGRKDDGGGGPGDASKIIPAGGPTSGAAPSALRTHAQLLHVWSIGPHRCRVLE
ncbi:unnamed protein product [Lampetra planeri]